MTSTRVLVTGAGGFLGSHLCRYLELNKGIVLFKTSLHADPSRGLLDLDVTNNAETLRFLVDVKPNILINLAGRTAIESVDEMFLLNAEVPKRLMHLVSSRKELAQTRLLLIGSAAEYGNNPPLPCPESAPRTPGSPYGRSKIAQSDAFEFYGKTPGPYSICLARPFNIIGPGMPGHLSIPSFLRQLRDSSRTIETQNLGSIRDFIDIRDVVEALWILAQRGQHGEAYNLCSGEGTSMRAIVDELKNLSRSTAEVIESTSAAGGPAVSIGDGAKMMRNFGWKPLIKVDMALRNIVL